MKLQTDRRTDGPMAVKLVSFTNSRTIGLLIATRAMRWMRWMRWMRRMRSLACREVR